VGIRGTSPILYLGSASYLAVFVASTVVYGLIVGLVGWTLSPGRRFVLIRQWSAINLFALRAFCGLRWRVEGLENLPQEPVVVFPKHQSTWETIALGGLLPPTVWVVKRELLWVPFFGWGIAAMRSIAIDRRAGRAAVEQMLEQGRRRLQQGLWVVVFPEGTRVLPGRTARYRMGGAILATETGTPVLPVAHNAGDFWPRHSFVKWPGEIVLKILPPIDSRGLTPDELNERASEVIESEMAHLSIHGAADTSAEALDGTNRNHG